MSFILNPHSFQLNLDANCQLQCCTTSLGSTAYVAEQSSYHKIQFLNYKKHLIKVGVGLIYFVKPLSYSIEAFCQWTRYFIGEGGFDNRT